VLSPDNGSLRINEIFVPKTGTRLATLINAPKLNEPNPKITSGLLGDATMLMDCTMANPDALTAFFVAEIKQLAEDMQLKIENLDGLIGCMTKWMGIYGGTFCESVDFGGDAGISVNYLLEVKDEKAALNLFKTMEQDMVPFLKLYEELGMPMSMAFQENVREYKGAKIHQFNVKMDMKSMMADKGSLESMEAMGMSNMVYDVAIVDGAMAYSMGSSKVEDLIDGLKADAPATSPLKARAVYPAGGFYYLDFDVGRYMAFVAELMPDSSANPMQKVANMLKGASPLTSAGFREDNRVMWSVNVPGDLIAKYGQMVMMLQMQKMQQKQGMPQGIPSGVPATMPMPVQ